MAQQWLKGSTNAPLVYRDTAVTNTAAAVTNRETELMGWNIINPNSTDVYVKFVDASSGTITVGTTAVVRTLLVPANTTIYQNSVTGSPQLYFTTGMSVYAVTALADSNTTAPSTAVHLCIMYKTGQP